MINAKMKLLYFIEYLKFIVLVDFLFSFIIIKKIIKDLISFFSWFIFRFVIVQSELEI